MVGGKGDRAVGCLGDERRLDVGGVALVDHTLEGGGNENVAVGLEQGGAVLGVFGTGETFHSTVFINVLFDRLDVEPIGGADGAVTLHDGDDLCAVFFAEKFSGVIADVAQALNHDAFAFECALEFGAGDILWVTEKFAQAELHTPAGGLGAAGDAAEVNWLAGDTAHTADLFGIKVLIRVGYPAHLSFAGAHVRGGDVEAGMNEVALGQLLREAARDFLQFVFGVISGINLQRALGTAKRNEHDGALVGHESGECLDFVLIGKIGVADATFHRENMLAVYSAPTSEYFVAVIQLDAEL